MTQHTWRSFHNRPFVGHASVVAGWIKAVLCVRRRLKTRHVRRDGESNTKNRKTQFSEERVLKDARQQNGLICSFSCFSVKYLELLVKLKETGHSRAPVVTLCGVPASPALMLKDIFSVITGETGKLQREKEAPNSGNLEV